ARRRGGAALPRGNRGPLWHAGRRSDTDRRRPARRPHRRDLRRAMTLRVTTRIETWPIAGSFVISRGARTEAQVVVAEVSDGTHTGRAECVPYARYGETVESVVAAIEAARVGGDREALRREMPAGA